VWRLQPFTTRGRPNRSWLITTCGDFHVTPRLDGECLPLLNNHCASCARQLVGRAVIVYRQVVDDDGKGESDDQWGSSCGGRC
jgi:hypothetical protein